MSDKKWDLVKSLIIAIAIIIAAIIIGNALRDASTNIARVIAGV